MVAVGWMLSQRSNVCVLVELTCSFYYSVLIGVLVTNFKQSRLLWLDLNNYVLTTILFESAKMGFNGSCNDLVLTSRFQFAYKVWRLS